MQINLKGNWVQTLFHLIMLSAFLFPTLSCAKEQPKKAQVVSSGRITFTGSIVEDSCELKMSPNNVISLGEYRNSRNATTAKAVPLTIDTRRCKGYSQGDLTLALSGEVVDAKHKTILKNYAKEAKGGVGVTFFEKTGKGRQSIQFNTALKTLDCASRACKTQEQLAFFASISQVVSQNIDVLEDVHAGVTLLIINH